MKNILVENIIKNSLLAVLLLFAFPSIQASFSSADIISDKAVIGNLLITVSIIAVIACFGNFAFSYEKVDSKNFISRFLGHLTSGILMLLIGLSLEMTSVLAGHLIKEMYMLSLSLFLFYVASILYDFWDLRRAAL